MVNLLSWIAEISNMYMEKSVRLAQTHHAKSCLIGLKLNTEMDTEHRAQLVPHQGDYEGAQSCTFKVSSVRKPLQARISPQTFTPDTNTG